MFIVLFYEVRSELKAIACLCNQVVLLLSSLFMILVLSSLNLIIYQG